MSQDFSYSKENGVIIVVTPYNAKFVNKARNLRGNWKNNAWHFDDEIEEYVKAALLECYGVIGDEPVQYCTLVISDYNGSTDKDAEELFGRIIARAFGRDSGAKLGDDIIWISGKYSSGGSVKNWDTRISDGFFEIQNVPVARTEFNDVQKAIAAGWCTIKYPKKKRTAEEVQADIDKYTAILEELTNELNSL